PRMTSQWQYIKWTIQLIAVMIHDCRIRPVARSVSGQISWTQTKIGARLKYLIIMAGIPTVIAPAWKTIIVSALPTRNGPKRLAESRNERQFQPRLIRERLLCG